MRYTITLHDGRRFGFERRDLAEAAIAASEAVGDEVAALHGPRGRIYTGVDELISTERQAYREACLMADPLGPYRNVRRAVAWDLSDREIADYARTGQLPGRGASSVIERDAGFYD